MLENEKNEINTKGYKPWNKSYERIIFIVRLVIEV
jgi:hypothetical protein